MSRLINKKVGILSGMGSAAGVLFYDLLVKECQGRGAKTDSDFPEIIIYNLSSEAMDKTGITDVEALGNQLIKGIKLLNWAECELIIIACNSAYIYYNNLQKISVAKILNMPEIAMKKCTGEYGVICSRFSKDNSIYAGIKTTDKEQEIIDRVIDDAIAGHVYPGNLTHVYSIIKNLISRGAKYVILGCTEISLFNNLIPRRILEADGCKIIDASAEVIKELFNASSCYLGGIK